MRIMKISLAVGGLIASAVLAGGTAVASPSNVATAQLAGKATCSVKVDKGYPAPIVDDHGYPNAANPKLAKGTSVKSACTTRTSPSGVGVKCGKNGDKLVKLAEGPYSGEYVPLTCVTHHH